LLDTYSKTNTNTKTASSSSSSSQTHTHRVSYGMHDANFGRLHKCATLYSSDFRGMALKEILFTEISDGLKRHDPRASLALSSFFIYLGSKYI
jgi:hypothetical protein